jgi:hypothetical protein
MSQKELDYFQFGKVFRFQNITSASIVKNPKQEFVYGGSDYNVEIHIYSTQGR